MHISTATMIASQTATTAPRSNDPAAEFAPLLFKKTQAQAVPSPAASAAAEPQARTASASTDQPASMMRANPGAGQPKGYTRPGSQLDIKV